MRSVLFFRHGKSDWDADYDEDHDRPLAGRGRKAARRMGRFLMQTKQTPDEVVVSTALRARRTFELAARAGRWPRVTVRHTGRLYEASPDAVLSEIRSGDDGAGVLMVVGHEPAWSETVTWLSSGARGASEAIRMPTGAVARVDFDVEKWAEVGPGNGQLAWLVTPKLLAPVSLKKR